MPVLGTRSFTYIELLIALAIIAVLFIPIMQLFSECLHSTGVSRDLVTAVHLARWGMERIKNLNITKSQLKEMGDSLYPAPGEEPLEINGLKWRIKREIVQASDPLEVRVCVFRDAQPKKPLVILVTLIEDSTWQEIRPK